MNEGRKILRVVWPAVINRRYDQGRLELLDVTAGGPRGFTYAGGGTDGIPAERDDLVYGGGLGGSMIRKDSCPESRLGEESELVEDVLFVFDAAA